MIQIIGLTIGSYVFTRMLEVLTSKGPTSALVKVFAALTAVIAGAGVAILLLAGFPSPTT